MGVCVDTILFDYRLVVVAINNNDAVCYHHWSSVWLMLSLRLRSRSYEMLIDLAKGSQKTYFSSTANWLIYIFQREIAAKLPSRNIPLCVVQSAVFGLSRQL